MVIIVGGLNADDSPKMSTEVICMTPNPQTSSASLICNPFKKATTVTEEIKHDGAVAVEKSDAAYLCGGEAGSYRAPKNVSRYFSIQKSKN